MLHYILAQVSIQLIFKNPPSHSFLLWVYNLMFCFHCGYYSHYSLFYVLLRLRLPNFMIIYPVQLGWNFISCV